MLIMWICAALLFASIGYLALYPSIQSQLQAFADDMPDAYKALLGDVDIATAEGYVRSQVYSLIAPLLMAGATISAGAGLAKAEQDQTLAALAVTPLSRRRLVGSWMVLIWAVATCAAVTIVIGVAVGAPLAGADVGLGRVVIATVPVLLFAGLIGTIALLAGVVTGSPGVATGCGWVSILVSFVISSIAGLVDDAAWLAEVSPWSWHGAGAPITTDLDGAAVALLLATSLAVTLVAVSLFERRNLHL